MWLQEEDIQNQIASTDSSRSASAQASMPQSEEAWRRQGSGFSATSSAPSESGAGLGAGGTMQQQGSGASQPGATPTVPASHAAAGSDKGMSLAQKLLMKMGWREGG